MATRGIWKKREWPEDERLTIEICSLIRLIKLYCQ